MSLDESLMTCRSEEDVKKAYKILEDKLIPQVYGYGFLK